MSESGRLEDNSRLHFAIFVSHTFKNVKQVNSYITGAFELNNTIITII